ncbi:MAG: UDP-N-acetylmuramate dehydrogenase [Sulfurimonadaceae bacterium]|jgi:UDP-N-acetylmuramate dehydrogenase|nr:UDP-N-acetylmuramate dehydrogenase [Sulfurimonadaceae bacterium]
MAFKSINFSKYSSMKLGGVHDVFVIEDCEFPDNAYLIGSCNNILMGDNPPPLMMLSKKYDYIKIENDTLVIGAATPSGKIASFCKKHNIGGLEFISHLPGTLGGIVKMNAGLKEWEIANKLISVKTCHGLLLKEDLGLGYRTSNIQTPILEATLALSEGFNHDLVTIFKTMRSNQPSTPSAGSCFKNPVGDYAGRLIEAVGLKGVHKGGMEFSVAHANFLVNHGGGIFTDALFLIQEAQKKVYDEFGIWLVCEIEVLEKNLLGEVSPLRSFHGM